MVTTSQVLQKASTLRGAGRNRRLPCMEKDVAFIEKTPLQLKNHVKAGAKKKKTIPCGESFMNVMVCLEKYDQNQSMCKSEIDAYQTCMKQSRNLLEEVKAAKVKNRGKIPVGADAKLDNQQMSVYMKRFPCSRRTGQFVEPQSQYPNN